MQFAFFQLGFAKMYLFDTFFSERRQESQNEIKIFITFSGNIVGIIGFIGMRRDRRQYEREQQY